VIGAAFALGCFTLTSPVGVDTANDSSRFALAVGLVLHVGLIVVCVLKGKLTLGLMAIVVPLLAIVGALRLAKPDSTWAKKVYGEGSRRMSRARRRYAARDSRWDPVRERAEDLIGGTPSDR
jgi:lysyl-tRNA synthetase class 2